jgi:hypothetical protein
MSSPRNSDLRVAIAVSCNMSSSQQNFISDVTASSQEFHVQGLDGSRTLLSIV